MEAHKLFALITLVSLMALVSMVLSEPHGIDESNNEEKYSKMPKNENDDAPAEENDVCRSDVCRERAQLINEYLSNDTDPCEDFYGYVCDKWINNHTTNGSYDSFKMLQDQFLKTIADTLQHMEPERSPQDVIDKPALLYNSCIDFTPNDELEAMLEIMNNSNFNEWPVITQTIDEKEIFSNASEVLLYTGMSPLINYYVSRNTWLGATHIIEIIPLGMQNLQEKEYICKAIRSVKPNITENDLKNITDGLEDLQRQWRNATARNVPAQPWLVNTTENLEKQYKKIPLHALLHREFLKGQIHLEQNETVQVYYPWIYQAINEFLGNADPVSLYNYVGLQTVIYWLSRSPLQVRDRQLKRERCADLVYSAMKEIVSRIYAEKYFETATKTEVEEMARRIKDAFEEAIKNTEWMDDETKNKSLIKLEHMTAKFGYPKWLQNTTVLTNLYEYVPVIYPNMSFFNILYKVNENRERKGMEKLRQPYVQDMEWFYSTSPVHAFFNPRNNEVVYPLGGIQYPFFELGLPWSLNLGGIGAVIAHETSHGYARASYFNILGGMAPLKAECFKYQYGNITDKETQTPLNGTNTLDENMADNGGLQIALKAYKNMIRDDCDNTTTSLEGLDGMSGLQLFFVSYATSWCHAISKEKLRYKIVRDSHSPNRYRVNVPMHNLVDFATAFNCSKESAMMKNITGTCTLW